MFFTKPRHLKYDVHLNEKKISSFLPYTHHWNSTTILTDKGDFISVIKVNGFSFETADDQDLDIKKDTRNNLLKGMASDQFSLWFHTFRRKHEAFPGGKFDNQFANMLNEQWQQKHDPDNTFINEHYITIIRKGNQNVSAFIDVIAKKFKSSSADDEMTGHQKNLMEAYTQLEEIRDRVLNAFSGYRAYVLGIEETEDGCYSQIMEFLSYILNVGHYQRVLLPSSGTIAEYMPSQRLYFGDNFIEAIGPNESRFAGIVSLKEYRPATFAGVLDGFLQMQCEFVISQSFSFSDRMSSITKMQLQQRRLIQAEDVAVSQIQEINAALDAAMSGEFAFGEHHLSIMCITRDQKSLDNAISQAVVVFANSGISAVREKINMHATFWAQLPGNNDFVVRKSTINSLNLAGFASFHNYPSGKATGNYWGDAVTVLQTTSGTPYFFNFHVRDVGHTMIIGPTGAGKTALMNFLCAQAQKYKPRMFFFDKDRGAEIFIRAIGGMYTILDPARESSFNPLQLEDTAENRSFLVEWIRALVSTNGEIVNATEMSIITDAVNGCYRLPKVDRKLSNIAAFFGLEVPGSIASRLAMWHSTGSRARIFDNTHDLVDFTTSKIFGFEMGKLLQDKTSLAPVLLYLFRKIQMSLDGTPTMVILDEAWALIDNPVFGPKIKDWLKVMRKLNAFVIFATQSVEDAAKSAISDTLVQQTATQIFLPNLKATPVYREVFMLSQREYVLVKTTDPGSRFFLIKQDNNGVIARIDLTGMTDCINVLSGRANTVLLLEDVIKEYGDQPRNWLNVFLKKARTA